MGWWTKITEWIISPEPEPWPPEPRIIALSRGSSWEDYPPSEVREVHEKFANAEIVIDVFGNVIKDRYRLTPRPATPEEIRKATTV